MYWYIQYMLPLVNVWKKIIPQNCQQVTQGLCFFGLKKFIFQHFVLSLNPIVGVDRGIVSSLSKGLHPPLQKKITSANEHI